MPARVYEPEMVPRRDDSDGPRPGASAQAHAATAPREPREEERREESLEEPGYGHGV